MKIKGEANIEKYVDAMRAYRALQNAEKLEGKTEERTRLLKAAKDRVSERMRLLTGGMLGEATRRMKTLDAIPTCNAA